MANSFTERPDMLQQMPHFANYRRDGYDCDAAYDDGLMRYSDKKLFDIIVDHGTLSAPELKKKAGVESKKTYAFDSAMTRLQMKAYIVPCSFYFPVDEDGNKKYSYSRPMTCRRDGCLKTQFEVLMKYSRRSHLRRWWSI